MTPEALEARDYTFCTAVYPDPLTFHDFLISTPAKIAAFNRAHAFATERWGTPERIHVYPRNYIRQARALFAAGMHD